MMNKVLWAALALVVASGARAQVAFDDIETYQRDAFDRDVTLCDRMASHPNDPERVTDGVSRSAMDIEKAIAACIDAVKLDPDNPRLNYQLARAFGYAGRHAESDPYRQAALRAGYPQSLFVIGYIRLEGWDGRPADACYGGELIRMSAKAERFAGLVGFPHYLLMGRFDGCESFPIVDAAEIAGFLAIAKERSSDYYQGLLVESLQAQWAARAE
ncbi:MAG: hypothetical protein AAF270_15755 [Pseudomonadota bacterium]